MLKILANDGIDQTAADCLLSYGHEIDTAHYELEELKERLGNYDVVAVRSATTLRKELLDAVADSKLKLIIRAGVGLDNIDVEYAQSKGIAVRNTPNSSSLSVAELALGHMFNLARHIHSANVTMRQGEWNKKNYNGIQLSGKTLGIIGFGRIGQEIAKKAHALDMKVLYYVRSGKKEGFDDFTFVDLDTLLAESDFITLHTPSNPDSSPILDAAAILKIKKGAYLINTARSNLVDYEAMLLALNENRLSGAGLDVFVEEPLKDMRLMNHPKISMTPHIGASTEEAQRGIGAEVCEVITKFFKE
ncbi:MAG: D-2-hydroxyacid dehydrogenase [Erysipelotrichaceae bacterium]|nr:D-2-hydroxyacid dehydrogenase [Erysipelotrichaceae bacterium]